MKTDAQKAFDLVDKMGETLNGRLHIIDMSTRLSEDVKSYRVYHCNGYCVDVAKEFACDPSDVANYEGVAEDGFIYSLHYHYDGFKNPKNDNLMYNQIVAWSIADYDPNN